MDSESRLAQSLLKTVGLYELSEAPTESQSARGQINVASDVLLHSIDFQVIATCRSYEKSRWA
jgi:hypothetical protein